MPILPPFFGRVIRAGLVVAAARIAVFWYVLIRHAMGRESLDEILLILLLYPEGLLIPRDWSWTLTRGIGFSGALLFGSLCITAFIAAVLRAPGRWRAKSKEY